MQSITQELINPLITGAIAALVWNHYRKQTLPHSFKYKTFGARFWTGTIDSCIMWPIMFALNLLLMLNLPPIMTATIIATEHIIWIAYTIYMHGKHGQTYGKMVCKVKVVNHDGEHPITYKQAAIREGIPLTLGTLGSLYFIYSVGTGRLSQEDIRTGALAKDNSFMILTYLSFGWFIIESITMLTNNKRRAIHDFIAGTVVIRTNLEPEA